MEMLILGEKSRGLNSPEVVSLRNLQPIFPYYVVKEELQNVCGLTMLRHCHWVEKLLRDIRQIPATQAPCPIRPWAFSRASNSNFIKYLIVSIWRPLDLPDCLV
jgi:hypothetical protein